MCISVSKKITRKLIGVCPLNLVLIISRSVFNIEKIWPNVQTPLCGKTTHYSLKIKFEPGLNTVVAVGEQEWSKIEAALYNTKINLSNKNFKVVNSRISLKSLDLWIFMCAFLHHRFIAFLIQWNLS